MLTRRTVLSAAIPGRLLAAQKLHLAVHPRETATALWGDRPLLVYRFEPSRPKPYIHPLYLPDGRPVTIDAPPDHVHHRGLMVAWSKVNGFDFWGETNPGPHGRIVHQRFDKLEQTSRLTLAALNHWVADGKTLLEELRTIVVPSPPREGVWLEWITELRAAAEPVLVSAEGHPYDGLGIRFLRSMDGGGVLNSEGTTTIDKANGEPARWCTYHGLLSPGETAGVAFFDHPSNPRHPSPFFVMNRAFGYMSAAPTFREPFRLAAGQSLRLRWGVLSYLGAPDAHTLDRVFQRWSK